MATPYPGVKYTETETFSIAGNQKKLTSETDIKQHVDLLKSQSEVKFVNISGNTIGIDAAKLLAEGLEAHVKTLEQVNFADIFTGRLADEIPLALHFLLPVLNKAPNLKIVDLSDNAFGLQTIEPLENYLNNAVYLEHLLLSNNGMGPHCAQTIGQCLYRLSLEKQKQGLPSLKTFWCGRNRLEAAFYLSVGLKAHKDLRIVKLYQNGMRPMDVQRMINQGLRYNTALTVLDFQDNTFTESASSTLAEFLPQWTELEELNVNDCLLKPIGCRVLVEAFKKAKPFTKLKHLRLQYNELEQPTLDLLAEVVEEKLPKLQTLELNGNRFVLEGNKAIESIEATFKIRGFGKLDEMYDLEDPDDEDDEESDAEEKWKDGEGDSDNELKDQDPNLPASVLEARLREMLQIEDLSQDLQAQHISQ